jgi:DNA-binding response OmpR family regulator
MGEKILVVDDDLEIQRAVTEPLEAAGYTVRVCDTGREVAAAIAEFKPDLLVLDVMLPGVDGYTLAKGLSENGSTCRLPIVIMSGLAPSESMFGTLPQVAAFVSKPFDPKALVETVGKALLPKE